MEKVISFDKPNDPVVLNKILSTLDKNKSAITFAGTAPADLNNGQFMVMDDGATRELYIKTHLGTLCKVTLTAI